MTKIRGRRVRIAPQDLAGGAAHVDNPRVPIAHQTPRRRVLDEAVDLEAGVATIGVRLDVVGAVDPGAPQGGGVARLGGYGLLAGDEGYMGQRGAGGEHAHRVGWINWDLWVGGELMLVSGFWWACGFCLAWVGGHLRRSTHFGRESWCEFCKSGHDDGCGWWWICVFFFFFFFFFGFSSSTPPNLWTD
jgi:hypothetical protein